MCENEFVQKARQAWTLFQLDTKTRARVLGFNGAHSCWRTVSCSENVPDVCVPTLALVAEDDPITPFNLYPLDDLLRNPYFLVATTRNGGHSDFFFKGNGFYQFERMAPKLAIQFFETLNEREIH